MVTAHGPLISHGPGARRVRCMFPDGSSRVILLGPRPTINTFVLIAKNHINTPCTNVQLRYGSPPTYTIVALNKADGGIVLGGLKGFETVWLDVCVQCKANNRVREVRRGFALEACRTEELPPPEDPSHPPISMETLGPNGFYYELASRELGVENFAVYSFSAVRGKHFLYLQSRNCLIEVSEKLLHLQGEESVPEEFLVSSGILYEIVVTHVALSHMSFYSFPVLLPGRLFVFDVGLNKLIETKAASPLAHALLGPVDRKIENEHMSWRERLPPSHTAKNCNSTYYIKPCVQVTSAFSLQYTSFGTLEESTSPVEHGCRSVPLQWSMGSSLGHSPMEGEHKRFSVADMTVYEPSSLDVALPRPTLQLQCLPPPCVYYTETDDDPR